MTADFFLLCIEMHALSFLANQIVHYTKAVTAGRGNLALRCAWRLQLFTAVVKMKRAIYFSQLSVSERMKMIEKKKKKKELSE